MVSAQEQPDRAAAPGDSIRPLGPPGREAVLVVLLVILAAALVLYRAAERPLFTAHEARAACVARHMLESARWPARRPSPWLVPQFSPDADPAFNYQKPPLYYWAVAAASLPLGEVTALTVRLPSAASMVLLVVITYYLGKALISVRGGFIAALVLVSTPKMLWWGRAAILDPMLGACIAGSLLFFFRAHRGLGGRWQYWLFWGLVGLGTLVKATALVVPLLTVGLYLAARSRQEGFWGPLWRLKPVSGPLVLAAVAAPWHVLAHVATAGEFTAVYWGIHVFGRATGTSVFEKTTAWWFYFPTIVQDLFPWIVFLPGALVQPWRRVSREHLGRTLFPMAWFLGSLAFFSAVSFRKDEYMLVAYPAAAMLIGYFLDYYLYARAADAALRRWVEAAFVVLAAAALLVGGAFLAVAWSPSFRDRILAQYHNATDRAVFAAVAEFFAGRLWVALLLVGPMMAGTVAALVALRRGRPAAAIAMVACTTILAFLLFVVMMVPVFSRTRSLAPFAAKVEAAAAARGPETPVLLAVEECHELAFLLKRATSGLEWPAQDLAVRLKKELAAGRSWLVVMDRKAYEKGLGSDPEIEWHVVDEMPHGHRRPMVLLELKRKVAGAPEDRHE